MTRRPTAQPTLSPLPSVRLTVAAAVCLASLVTSRATSHLPAYALHELHALRLTSGPPAHRVTTSGHLVVGTWPEGHYRTLWAEAMRWRSA